MFDALLAQAADATRHVGGEARRRWNLAGRVTFEDRSTDAEELVVLLAGYKEHLWPFTIPRLAAQALDGIDVCLASAGLFSPTLSEIAAEHGWSYLSTPGRRVGVVQNHAIARHPRARLVHKVDEDVLLPAGYLQAMRDGLERVQREARFRPGFVSPILNVNGFSYVDFLAALGLEDDYRREFGPLTRAGAGVPAHDDGRAALWLWRNTVPFDEVAARFAERPFACSAVPHRFSIGAILFERELWERVGGLWGGVRPPGLGADEKALCRECVTMSRVMLVLHNVLAGHFAFGPQDARMREALPELAAGLALRSGGQTPPQTRSDARRSG